MLSPNPNSDLPWHYISKLVCIGDSGTGKSSLTIRLCEGRFIPSHDVTIGVEFGSRVVPVGPPANAALGINNPTTIDGKTSSTNGAGGGGAAKGADNPANQKKMKLSLWDTAGQETYKSITRSYFRGASGALLVFDISRRSTFESATSWLHDLRQIAEEDIVVILVGNKSDLANTSDDSTAESNKNNNNNNNNNNNKTNNKRQVTRQEAEAWCSHEANVLTYVETSAKSGHGVERAFLEIAERIYQNIEAGKYDLNDRRSGVKGYGTVAGGIGGGGGKGKGGKEGGQGNAGTLVTLGMDGSGTTTTTTIGNNRRMTAGGAGGGCC